MKLRTRLVLAMLACALVPVAVAGVVAHVVVAQRSGAVALRELDVAIALTALASALWVVLVAWRPARMVVGPIGDVAEAADRIAQGARGVQLDEKRAGAGEAGRLVRAFNHMARELDAAASRARRAERIAAWRDIARQMAHEIKNPLTPIQMAVEMLRKARERNLPDFEQLFDEETRIVLEEVARLRRLVENFSRFARAPRPRLEVLTVADVVAHVVGLHAASTDAPGAAEVTGEAPATLPVIRADREQLTQVLVNLVANASHAAEDRARRSPGKLQAAVHVSARALGKGMLAIDVDDNGAGIDPMVADRLFEPYVTTKKAQGGSGLGLAIVYRIVHDHGGTVTVESSPEGTRFEVVLPVSGPPVTMDATLDSDERPL